MENYCVIAGDGQIDIAGAGAWYGVARRGIADNCRTGSNRILLYLAHDACVRNGLQHGSVGKRQPRMCARRGVGWHRLSRFHGNSAGVCAHVMESCSANATSRPASPQVRVPCLPPFSAPWTYRHGICICFRAAIICIDRAGLGDSLPRILSGVSFVHSSRCHRHMLAFPPLDATQRLLLNPLQSLALEFRRVAAVLFAIAIGEHNNVPARCTDLRRSLAPS